jgi:hypothetical protein
MIVPASDVRVLLATGRSTSVVAPTGPAAIVQTVLRHDPFSGTISRAQVS